MHVHVTCTPECVSVHSCALTLTGDGVACQLVALVTLAEERPHQVVALVLTGALHLAFIHICSTSRQNGNGNIILCWIPQGELLFTVFSLLSGWNAKSVTEQRPLQLGGFQFPALHFCRLLCLNDGLPALCLQWSVQNCWDTHTCIHIYTYTHTTHTCESNTCSHSIPLST